MPDDTLYINSIDYSTLKTKLKELDEILEARQAKSFSSRELRYGDVDIEAKRANNSLQPDELYIPQHVIDTNIRREQSAYIQYLTQSPRAGITEDVDDLTVDMSVLDKDLSKKLRYDGWQLQAFSNVDSFQANGHSVLEVVMDLNAQGEVAHEAVEYGDFGFLSDTRNIQDVEMVERAYYFTKTRLIELCGDGTKDSDWSRTQVDKVIAGDPTSSGTSSYLQDDSLPKSLYKVKKVMFRVNAVVHVAWCHSTCDNWLRIPRKLYLGRRKLAEQPIQQPMVAPGQQPQPQMTQEQYNAQLVSQGSTTHTTEEYETEYPYIIYPYLISENDTIEQLKGRIQLDQDVQEAITSLVSSACTGHRRAAGLYGSRDSSDPNDDVLTQKNIYLKSGTIISSKVQFHQLTPPDPGIFTAINALVSSNQNETSQVNFAVTNRKDSRKTAEEIKTAQQQSMILSTVQVVLFSIALKSTYTKMAEIIKSRVLGGLIKVSAIVLPYYARQFIVKPSGDADVVEKQQLTGTMLQMWPIISTSPLAETFMIDLLELMFPLNAQKYISILSQAQAAQQSQQAQQQKMMLEQVGQMANGIVQLSKKPEYFSDIGKIHALPAIESVATQIETMQKQMQTPQAGTQPTSVHGQQQKMMQ